MWNQCIFSYSCKYITLKYELAIECFCAQCMHFGLFCLNPLTTDDECTHHATLDARYQLAQSVFKIGFVLAKKVG